MPLVKLSRYYLRKFKWICLVDAPNDSNEYSFNVRPVPEGSFFNPEEGEFTVELFYNEDLKITVDSPVIKASAVVYHAFTLVPSQGIYQVLNEFE